MHPWLITQVEDEDLLETNRGETRGKNMRTLEDEKEEPLDEEEREETLDKEERREENEGDEASELQMLSENDSGERSWLWRKSTRPPVTTVK